MKSSWDSKIARKFVDEFAEQQIGEDIALRVYTSRLLGKDPQLVIHGGGNTSVKTIVDDFMGDPTEVLCVKGSGWDLDTIEPAGLPAVRLTPLLRMREREYLSDEDMVSFQRQNLLDPASPNPSVETLLHAYLPHKFVDHTHACAVLSLTNQANGIAYCEDLYGDDVSVAPFVMPGFQLSKAVADLWEAKPDVLGIVLYKHGIFTFGETAEESYERMIELVDRAEHQIAKHKPKIFSSRGLPNDIASSALVAPILRGACAGREGKHRLIVEFRYSEQIQQWVNGKDLTDYAARGVITPDHIIRTKNKPLVCPLPIAGRLAAFADEVDVAVAKYVDEYDLYFKTNNKHLDPPKTQLDPYPRVVLVPGVGMFALGKSKQAASIAADLAEISIGTIADTERFGHYEALPDSDLFDMEYWSLEQAKLGKSKPKLLAGQVAVITGGAGTIGRATGQLFAEQGAEVALLDLDGSAVERVALEIGGVLGLACDVNSTEQVQQAFDQICETYGGLDILVSNAGGAPESWQAAAAELDEALLRESFDLNFFSHQRMAQQAVRVMRAQGTGGVLLFNASKQAVNPGENFSAYGLPKAATLFLSRQYALENGRYGIRSNAVNADRIRSGLLTDEMLSTRSSARGLTEDEYLAGNLLGLEVEAADVAQAFLQQVILDKTTANVTTVDGGNIAAALR
jgi:rhamnose utilization protein RhaD (predicted bifunctional aldolase and dehydrogenase)/NAD(P)-dependent dehydrogenase (short-subunit alcohol dehydrogenase family)